MCAKLSEEQINELKQAFAAMDTNGDGQVTKEELKSLLSQLGETVDDAVIDEMIKIADVNGDGNPDLIFGTTDDMFFPSRVYLNRNNRFNIVDAIIPINISNFWAIDIVVSNSNIYFYGLKNYNTTYDSINIYKYNFSTGAGSVIYNSNGRRWLNANIEIDWVWMFPYNGNLVPLSDLYTGVSIPM